MTFFFISVEEHSVSIEHVRDWLFLHPIMFGLGTTLIGIVMGACASWAISAKYYRKGSTETPDWVKKELLPLLPEQQPSPEELTKIVFEALPKHNVLETGSNCDGHWFRYRNGDQTCTGSFVIPAHGMEAKAIYPQPFLDGPALELSGEVGLIRKKLGLRSELLVELHTPSDQPLVFTYQARGHWISPHEVENNPST